MLNLQENTAVIKAGMDEETFRDRTKEGNVRLIALTEDVVEALNSLPRSLSGFVFDKKGKPVTMKTVWRSWTKAAKKAGVEVGPYQATRHSLASQLVNQDVPGNILKKILGHKTNHMIDRYAKLHVETMRRALEKRPSVNRQQRKKGIK